MKVPVGARLGVLATIWGSSFLFIHEAVADAAPVLVAFGRLLGGAAFLVGLVVVTRQTLPRERAVYAHLAGIALVANVIPFTLFAIGEERIPSALAGVDNAATPLFVAPFALLIVADEKLSRQRVFSLGVGFAGVLICLQPWKGLGSTDVLGQVACLSAAACYGVAIPWTRRAFRSRSVPVTVLAAGQVTMAALELGVVVAVGSLLGLIPAPHATPPGVLSLLTLGIVGTGLAYPLYFGLIRDLGAAGASTVTYLTPPVAVLLGVTLLGETLTWQEPVGAVLVVAGVALADRKLPRLGLRPRPAAS